MSVQSDLTCLACLEQTRAALANGRLGPMCSGCQKDYDENTRDQPKRKCSQCRQMWPEFEFNRKGVTVKVCSFCRAEFSARARHAALSHPPREKGVTDADLRMAYVKLYRSHKDGQDEPGAMLGPVIDVLVAAGTAEPVENGCYRITDAGITAWAHMASQTAGKFDLDSKELMERAGWIMSVRQLLEALEDEAWQALKAKIAYDVCKAARDAGFVEVSGHTSGQMWHITNEGVAELARLRAEDAPTFDPESPLAFDGRQSLRESYEMSRAAAAQTVDESIEDPEPEGYVEAIEEVDWQRIADERLEDLNHVRAGLDEVRTSRDHYAKLVNDFEAAIDALVKADKSPLDGIEYVKDLRKRLTDALNYTDPDMDWITGWAVEDGAGDVSPSDYVEGLREKAAQLQKIYDLMRQDDNSHANALAFVLHLLIRISQAEIERDASDAIVAAIAKLAGDQGRGELPVIRYVEWLVDVVDTLGQSNNVIYTYVSARYTAELARLAITYGGAQ